MIVLNFNINKCVLNFIICCFFISCTFPKKVVIYKNNYINYANNKVKKQLDAHKLNSKYNRIVNFEDLIIYSIPYFKLKNDINNKFDFNKNIEDFIRFENNDSFQEVLIFYKDSIPLGIFDRNLFIHHYYLFNNNDRMQLYDEKNLIYENTGIFNLTDVYNEENILSKINFYNGDFYFRIYGIMDELFYVDKFDKKIYTCYIGRISKIRQIIPINEYIQKYYGMDFIKNVFKGYEREKVYPKQITCDSCKSEIKPLKIKIIYK